MKTLILDLLNIYLAVLFGRVILSWFPISPNSAMASIYTFLYRLTEPVLGPVRRIMPRTGMFDLSPLVVFFAIAILRNAIS